jgi:UDP-N-acetylglucosamine acyltransferase
MSASIHETALVDPAASLGADVEIGPGALVGPEVELADGVRVGTRAILTGRVVVGADTRIWPGAILGEEPQDRNFKGLPSGVVVGERCAIREYVTVHRGSFEGTDTVIGDDVMLMHQSHVAHNCVISDGATIAGGALIAGHAEVGGRAFVSGNVTVHQFARIGRNAMIGGLSRVARDVPPFALLVGDSSIRGVNVVGLRRGGFERQAVREIRAIFKRQMAHGGRFDRGAEALRAMATTPEAIELVEFLNAPSKRGFCGSSPEYLD